MNFANTLKPKTTWNYSLETEADRVVQAAVNTFNRFYTKYGFLVLPYRVDGNASVVYLPNLKFKNIPSFIKKVGQIEPKTIPVCRDTPILQCIGERLVKLEISPEEEKIKKLKKAWRAKEAKFWQFLFQVLPELNKKQIEIEIRPTSFGSITSFNLVNLSAKKLNIKFYLRVDGTSANIAEAILSSLFTQQIEKESCSWEEKEAVIDFLMNYTQLKNIFPDYQPTLENIRKKERGKLVLASQEYLKKLGVPGGKIFSFKNGEIIIDRKTPFAGLTKNEQRVLKLLVKNKNQLCSFDQIGEAIWQEKSYESFSPWAVTKLIQRLREKLQANDLSPSLIQAQRGQGYILKD